MTWPARIAIPGARWGSARFTGEREVTVETPVGDLVVTAATVVINTGTVPARPDVPGLDLPRVPAAGATAWPCPARPS